MIDQPYTSLPYTIPPARGQALLNFTGRRMPDHLPLFEVSRVEEIRPILQPSEDLPGISDARMPVAPGIVLHGDCLGACAYLNANNIKVDLVYIDPPFASGANYAKKIILRNRSKTAIDNESCIGEEIMYGDIWQKEDFLKGTSKNSRRIDFQRIMALKMLLI
jgi:adenine-specific DNA-methyltransferase